MSIWKHLFSLEERRNWWTRKMPDCPLRDFYEVPFPDRSLEWRQTGWHLVGPVLSVHPGRDEVRQQEARPCS